MLTDNLIMLRKLHGFSQEEVADQIGISRQAYAKWEKGLTIPDIEKCALLADLYDTTVDALIKTAKPEGMEIVPPAPKGKNIWGSVAINDRGQIVIPKGARDRFNLTGGQRLIVLSDEAGIALIPDKSFEDSISKAMEMLYSQNNEN
ncbi:MAG: helix-turn-helix domain-containing protein [Solobacterium sp.]|nr:helix-turn-helix domain-containing protein [Solobacterium sp.]